MSVGTVNEKIEVAKSSVLASLFLTSGKAIVGITTGSLGILSEAAHSALDLIAALITYFAVKASDKPADEEHHYGHAKIENFSALIEAVLLLLTCGWIVWEAADRLFFNHVTVEVNIWSYAIIIISIVVDYSRARALYRVAKEHNSQALEADALHFSSDIISSGVVLLGLILARFGINFADSLAALFVAVIVMIASVRLARKTIDALIDKAPTGLAGELENEILKMSGVKGVHKVRLRQVGGGVQGDLHLVMEENVSFVDGHKIATEVEKKLAEYNHDIIVHFEPSIDSDDVAIDIEKTTSIIKSVMDENNCEFMDYHEIAITPVYGDTIVSVHVVLPRGTSIKDARARCDNLEQKIKSQLKKITVHFHIEPCDNLCGDCTENCSE